MLEFKLLNKDTFEEQCYVYSMAFGHNNKEFQDRWQKKHFENPLGNSLIFGAYIDNKLVGINCFQPCHYECNGKIYNVFQSCESGVLPEYQGKGIWGKLMRFAENYIKTNVKCDILVGFPNYKTSYPGFKKMGWDTICIMNNYLLVSNSMSFLKAVLPNKKYLHSILASFLNIQKYLIKLYKTNKLYVETIPNNMLIWNSLENNMSLNFSENYLNWKLDYKKLLCLHIKDHSNTVLATCIYGFTKYNNEDVICINKLTFASNNKVSKKIILANLCTYWLKMYPNTAFIRVWTMSNDNYNKLFRGLLFFKTSHPNPFITKKILDNGVNYKWNVSFIDLD